MTWRTLCDKKIREALFPSCNVPQDRCGPTKHCTKERNYPLSYHDKMHERLQCQIYMYLWDRLSHLVSSASGRIERQKLFFPFTWSSFLCTGGNSGTMASTISHWVGKALDERTDAALSTDRTELSRPTELTQALTMIKPGVLFAFHLRWFLSRIRTFFAGYQILQKLTGIFSFTFGRIPCRAKKFTKTIGLRCPWSHILAAAYRFLERLPPSRRTWLSGTN